MKTHVDDPELALVKPTTDPEAEEDADHLADAVAEEERDLHTGSGEETDPD